MDVDNKEKNEENTDGNIPEANLSLIKRLVSYGADINVTSSVGETPLLLAVKRGSKNLIHYFLRVCPQQVNVNERDLTGNCPLSAAATIGDTEVIEWLLENGALCNDDSTRGLSVLYWCVRNSTRESVTLLRKYGAVLNYYDVCDAANRSDERVTEMIKEMVLDLRIPRGRWRMDSLQKAVLNHDEALVRYMLSCGADPNYSEEPCWAPLRLSLPPRNHAIFRLLLATGADPNVFPFPAVKEFTLFQEAVSQFEEPTVRQMVESGSVDLHKVNSSGWTALHFAVERRSESLIKYLLEVGVPVDVQNCKGATALHMAAARQNNRRIFDLLIEGGARVDIKNDSGLTAPQIADIVNQRDLEKSLLRAYLKNKKRKIL